MLANPDADLTSWPSLSAFRWPRSAGAEATGRALAGRPNVSPGRVYVPINPDVALDALLSLEQAEISRRERQLLEARAELARLVRNSDDRTAAPIREVRRVDGRERVLEVLRELFARCYQETLNVLPGAPVPPHLLTDAAEHDLALLKRGVRFRTLYTRQPIGRRADAGLHADGARARRRGPDRRHAAAPAGDLRPDGVVPAGGPAAARRRRAGRPRAGDHREPRHAVRVAVGRGADAGGGGGGGLRRRPRSWTGRC